MEWLRSSIPEALRDGLMNEAAEASLNRQLASERDHFVQNLHHANGGIGIAAFLAKQVPRYE